MFKGKMVTVFARNAAGFHVPKEMRWGLIPTQYAAAPELFEGSTTHARLETVDKKPYFADCWRKKRRCLFAVESFKQKVPAGSDLFGGGQRATEAVIQRSDGQPLGIAGIYNAIHTPEGLLLSAAMLTREPGPAMAKIHDREPAVIEPDQFAAWLDGSDALDLLRPWADDAFVCKKAA